MVVKKCTSDVKPEGDAEGIENEVSVMTDPVISNVDVNTLAKEIAAQAAQGAAQQAAAQVAQQVSEQVSQAVSAAVQKFMQTSGASTIVGREELGDIGGTERIEKENISESGILFSNNKRTYDEYQHESLESVRRNRSYVDKTLSDAHSYDMGARNIANQALQNAVETANMVGKQAVRHGDIAIDNQWNPVQQGAGDTLTARAVSIDDASLKAIGAMVAASLAEALTKKVV